MKEITVQDCLELKNKFDQYCQTAEQHEFPMLAIRAMFRVVLKLIGQDFSEYIEKEGDVE